MSQYTINSETSLQKFIGEIRQDFAKHKFLRVTTKTGRQRSINQNDISHVWYEQIARELLEDDVLGWRCYCKLHHGVPLLRAEDAEFREFYDSSIKGLSYEKKLQAMKFMPVTSLMTKAQISKFLELVQADFAARGVMLEFPDERIAA